MKKMSNGKAVGEDGIALEHLSQGGENLTHLLLLILNFVWHNELAPRQWKATTIVPIFKAGDRKSKKNYRPISLITVVAKIFTSIINARISNHLENNHLLAEEQAGFRPKRSCVSQSFILSNILAWRKRRFMPTALAFLDISQAYDTVCREKTWLLLHESGITGKLWSDERAVPRRRHQNCGGRR